jgi:molybdopterin/thiamine biosynthesis adenylyltransferase
VNNDPFARYHRQMLISGIGPAGQSRLACSTAMLVGLGALGCVAGELLARAGVGRLILIDRDVVELTNLQRQTLYTERDASDQAPKAIAAAQRLSAVNSSIDIVPVVTDVTHRTVEELLARYKPTILLDGTDNFHTRFLMNDVAVKHAIPLAYAGVIATGGMQFTVRPGITPCMRCLFDDSPTAGGDTCDTAGVIGPAVMIAAAHQASDAIKVLAGLTEKLPNNLLQFDLWGNTHRTLSLGSGSRKNCVCCADREFAYLRGDHADTAAVLCGRNAVQIWAAEGRRQELGDVHARLCVHGSFVLSPVLVRGIVRDAQGDAGAPIELTVFADGRTLVRGTSSIERARALHARYVGA